MRLNSAFALFLMLAGGAAHTGEPPASVAEAASTVEPGNEKPASPGATHGWPLSPSDSAHVVGTAIEYVGIKNVAMHEGIDVMGRPWLDPEGRVDPAASRVVAAPGGQIVQIQRESSVQQSLIVIRGDDARTYSYGHLEPSSIPHGLSGTRVAAGTFLGGIARSNTCDFHHLHYQVSETRPDGTTFALDPLEAMSPRNDATPPVVEGPFLIVKTQKEELEAAPGQCVTSGADLIVTAWDLGDTDRAGGPRRIGVRKVETTVSSSSASASGMRHAWNFSVLDAGFRVRGAATMSDFLRFDTPHATNTDYCADKIFAFRAATIELTAAGPAEIKGATYRLPAGEYVAAIEVEDFNSNKTRVMKAFCVGPSPH